jgi:PAS domain S-box-containing protein
MFGVIYCKIRLTDDYHDKGNLQRMSAEITDRKMLDENLLINQELYRVFVSQSSEAIWRMEMETPVAVNLPVDEQIELFYTYGFLAECNDAMARMYGYTSANEIIGARLGDFVVREDEANIEYLRAFITLNYRLEDAESHEVDRAGNPKFFLNNLIGIVENGFLKRAWGTQRDITERKEIERSKAHLAAIVEFSDDAIISKDLDGTITSWNKGAEKTFGYTPPEVIGKSIKILIPPHLLEEETKILESIRQGRSVEHFETVRQRKDRSYVNISLTVSPIKNESGAIIGASKIARDITGRKEAEDLLRESQAILALSMQSSQMGAWTRDLATETVWWSEELEAIFGLKKGAFGASVKAFFDLVYEEDRGAVWNEIERAVEEHREYWLEFRFWHADGSVRWMEGRGRAVYSEEGRPVRLYGIGIDVTERKQAEEKLRESEKQLRVVTDTMPALISYIDADCRYHFVNQTYTDWFGETSAELIGKTMEEVLGAAVFRKLRPHIEAALAGLPQVFEIEASYRTGGTRFIRGNYTPDVAADGTVKGFFALVLDITTSKHREKNTEFLAEISQDLTRLTNDREIMRLTAEKIVDHLGLAHCTFTEYDLDRKEAAVVYDWGKDSAESLVGVYRLADFGDENRFAELVAGKQIAVNDTAADPRTVAGREKYAAFKIGATANSPYLSDGRCKASLTVHRRDAHEWQADELELLSELSNRIWARIERARTEEALRESEERFAKAFNSSPLVLTITSLKDGKLIEVNETFIQVTGFSRAEAIGRTTAELGLWKSSGDREAELAAVQAAGEIRDLEYEFQLRDGRKIIGLLSAELLEIRGEPCALTVIQDITERKKAEEISDRYRLLSMRARDIILFFRRDGRIVDANQEALEAYGYDQAELLQKSLSELRAPETLAVLEEQMRRADSGGIQFETVHLRRDGTRFPVEVSSVGADIGGERLLISIIRDISERRKNEEIVRQSMKQLRLVTDIAPVYIAHCDREMRFKFVNQAYAERFGLTAEECIGLPIREILGEAGFESILGYIETVLSGQPVEFEITVPYPKIGEHFMHCSYAPEFDEDGRVIGWVAAITDISERRKMEEAIRENEEQLRQMANAMPQVVWIADAEGVVRYYNNRVTEFYGVEESREGTWHWQPSLYRDDLEATLREWQTATRNKRGYTKEHRIQMADGSYRWHLSRAIPVLDANGEILKWYGTATDIHDIKQAEESLRESEKRFRTMANNAPMLVWMSGTDKYSAYFNQSWLDFTGRTMEEEIGDRWMEGIHEEDRARCREVFSTTFEAREDFEIEYRLRRFDGEYRWILDKGVPLFTHNGTFKGYIGSCIDITERKQGQEALLKAERRASEEYLELLSRIVPVAQTLGTARDLLSIYRALHEFVRVSMPCTAFFVSSYNAEKSLRLAEYVWGEDGEVDISMLPPMPITPDGGPNSQAIFEKRSVVVNRYWDLMKNRPHIILQEDGKDPHSSLVVPMTVMSRIIGTLEVQAYQPEAFTNEHIIALEMVANLAAVAIENVRLLQVEADARETAEAANRAKDEFLSVLSHELRTPLNSMLGWTRMLRAGVLDEEKTGKAIEVIERNTMLQNNLIEDLLDVSRIISGKMRIEKESVDLVKIFNDSIETLRPFAVQKNISFKTETSESSLIIDGDATRFQQVISNLVQNSVKFTGEGGEIAVDLSRHDKAARLVVKDNGIGIDKELLPFIFERFRQADSSTKRAYSGLGLGLTIVRNLVELHGGTIQAESAGSGKGATFIVEIPLTEEFLEKNSSNGQGPRISGEYSALAGARILLVDDDSESLIPLQLFLEKENAEIVTATSAREALEKLAGQSFHILITDIGMPLADGYDLIARVRQLQTEQNAFITAIALTAYASSDDRRRALAAGFQGHLAKPVDYDELLAVIKGFYEKMK